MRIARIQQDGTNRLAIDAGSGLRLVIDTDLPDDPLAILADPALTARAVAAATGPAIDEAAAAFRLPLAVPGRIFCVGLNYADHAKESPYEKPNYPVYFLRVDTGLIPHGAPIVRPLVSTHLDFEGEIAAVIGTGGRNIPMETALDHVAAYTIFNDGSIRDYQFKGPQWTLGKNFDETGPLGPWLVPAADLPPGIKGLRLQTRLNGQVVQEANTDDLLFPVPEVIARLSEAVTLKPGDVIATGTPAGVGFARKPPLFMKHGDVVEIEVEGIGILRNPVRDEVR
ncbi:fumarylacetoacetate hydrolase family protein [Prosthecodimorpha staleyi]|uniref:Fumarylacetoacetate hydrolase family protein n=1 Tax=Prosthecodimorpha staleyi TaxID=2840188 RepID=A0A947DBT6_9HYPH|nr:fumarylacetoacetate hydrolase family protein [Prosthecodimorpha staleyi]MBT9291554.1 fumarylacetoacetate hydrolase family protein [Prosthecodimorpha staleyi]